MGARTDRQVARQRHRSASGKHYFSWSHANRYGAGIVLCEPCAEKLDKMGEQDGLATLRGARC